MSVEFGGQPAGLGKLRTGAALALVLATAAGVLPASAQSAPEAIEATTAPTDAAPAAEDDQAADRERVYVFGKRAPSSVATVNTEDAPQVINIIDGETLAEQGVTSLEQALRNVPGITTQIGEGGVMSGDQFFIRGVSAKNDIFTDGLRDFGVFTRDAFNYGQVEVFKGPSASAFGRGAAGGGINTTSKTPYLENGGSINGSIGDAEYGRVIGDWNQVLGDGVAVRIAGMVHQQENTGRDIVKSERWGVAPSVGFGLDGDTTVTVAYLHQYEDKVPDYGLPTVTVNGVIRPITDFGVDSKTYLGFITDKDETTVDTFTVRARHTVNDWLSITNDTKYGYYQRYSQFTPVSCNAACVTNLTDGNPATAPLGSPGGPGPYDQDTRGVQNITTASITAPIGPLRNELLVGVDASWQNNDRNQYSYTSRPTTQNVLNPDHVVRPTVSAAKSNIRDTTAYDVSIFASDRLWFTEELSLVLGARMAWYEVDQNTTTFNQATSCNGGPVPATPQTCYTAVTSESDFVTPQAGVIWEPSANQSYWINYAQSAKPPGVSVANGDTVTGPTQPNQVTNAALDPEESSNIEVGGRVGFLDNRFQFQGAVFQTKKDNAKETDPVSNNIVLSGDAQEITGVELGIAGAITDQWSINANVTYLDTETTDAARVPASATCVPVAPATTCPSPNIGKNIAFTPETAASLWMTYNFTGALAGLEIGGGLTYQDDVWLSAANTATAPSFTTLDALVSYGFDRFLISLNAYNLTDELYFPQVHGNRLTPGQGRTFIGTLGVVF
ncbi:MAG: TonB-dependent receptor [Hyphomonadaceae bacterium]|nr:TonB-dependent receptor [Hyphomonadaceae bacterium]